MADTAAQGTLTDTHDVSAMSVFELAAVGLKRCSRAGCVCPVHPFDDFQRDARRGDGRHPWCKPCKKKVARVSDAARQQARGKELNAARESRRTAEQERERKARRQAREQAGGVDVVVVSVKDQRRLTKRCCTYCGGVIGVAGQSETPDHVVALSRGGRHGVANLTPACFSCNSGKGDKTITEWIAHRVRVGHPVPAGGLLALRQPWWQALLGAARRNLDRKATSRFM